MVRSIETLKTTPNLHQTITIYIMRESFFRTLTASSGRGGGGGGGGGGGSGTGIFVLEYRIHNSDRAK